MRQSSRKKIMILTSRGGGGHEAAKILLEKRLEPHYDISTVNILTEIWGHLDPFPKITFGKWTGEDMYNYFLRNNWHRMINVLDAFGEWRMQAVKKDLVDAAVIYLQENKPDLIISVMSIIDPFILLAAEQCSLPFLVVNVDLDASIYLNGVNAPTYKKFYFTVPFDDSLLYDKIAFAHLPPSCVKPIGFPLRDSFFKMRCTGCIKDEFDIPEDVPVVMIMMGGQGSALSYKYVKKLAHSTDRMHLVVCLGRNESLRKRIEQISLPENISITIVGFTQKIPDLMAAADLLITKPGPTTVCEALHMQLPLLLSCVGKVIKWEHACVEFVLKHDLGTVIRHKRDVVHAVHEWLVDTQRRADFKAHVGKFNQSSFQSSFDALVVELLNQ